MYQSISFCGFCNPCLSVIGCWDPLFLQADSVRWTGPPGLFWLLLPCCSALDQPRVVDALGDHPWIKRAHCSFDPQEWLKTHPNTRNYMCAWLHVHKRGGSIIQQKIMNLIWWHTQIFTTWNIYPSPKCVYTFTGGMCPKHCQIVTHAHISRRDVIKT